MIATETFKPGLYRYTMTGGLYTALCLVTHHEGRHPMVLYVSHKYGGTNVRPLYGVEGDPDGFLDAVSLRSLVTGQPDVLLPRFTYVGVLPSAVPVEER